MQRFIEVNKFNHNKSETFRRKYFIRTWSRDGSFLIWKQNQRLSAARVEFESVSRMETWQARLQWIKITTERITDATSSLEYFKEVFFRA